MPETDPKETFTPEEVFEMQPDEPETSWLRDRWEGLRHAHWLAKVGVSSVVLFGASWILVNHAVDRATENSAPIFDGATQDVKTAVAKSISDASCGMKQQVHDEVAGFKADMSKNVKDSGKSLEKAMNRRVDDFTSKVYEYFHIDPSQFATTSTTPSVTTTTAPGKPQKEAPVC